MVGEFTLLPELAVITSKANLQVVERRWERGVEAASHLTSHISYNTTTPIFHNHETPDRLQSRRCAPYTLWPFTKFCWFESCGIFTISFLITYMAVVYIGQRQVFHAHANDS